MSSLLASSIAIDPAHRQESLAAIPGCAGVFALYAEDPAAEPYLSKAHDLRRRLRRLLELGGPASAPGKRLRLAQMVHRIEFTPTGSEFESSLCLYAASLRAFGDRARRRLRLRPPAFLRMSTENAYPRLYPTSRIAVRAAGSLFGPFPSRAAAEHYAEELLNLFLLRRCHQDLQPDPAFPGCVYSEMKMCLAPCYRGCTDDRYREEAAAVLAFLCSRGASLTAQLEKERSEASEALEFERAAAIHQRMQKVKAVAQLAGDAVRPLSQLNGTIVQQAAAPGHVALFGLRAGVLSGPALFSTGGMRHPNEQSGSSSLFAHPVAIAPVPLEGGSASRDLLESRLQDALALLPKPAATSQLVADHLAIFARWFYRPASRRAGEAIFAPAQGEIASKLLLRAISRVAVGKVEV